MDICLIKKIIGIVLILNLLPTVFIIMDHLVNAEDTDPWGAYKAGWVMNTACSAIVCFIMLIAWLLHC